MKNINIQCLKPYLFSNISRLFIRITLSLLILILHFTCGSSGQSDSKITFTTAREDLTITVDAEGILEAKNSININAPQFRDNYTITYMIPEGSKVKKGDVVAVFKSSILENEYKNAKNELDIAIAEREQKDEQLKAEMSKLESQLKSYEASLSAAKLRLAKIEFVALRKQEIEKLEIKTLSHTFLKHRIYR